MQTIEHPTKHIHPIFNDFDYLYTQVSVKEKKQSLVENVYDSCFQPLFEIFTDNGYKGGFLHKDKHYREISLSTQNKPNMLVCFSGGKDSIATAKYYIDRNYNVYLYHLKGINFTYKDEYINAQKVAEYLGVPICVEEIKLSGKQDWVEHPMKNMIIANRALQYGIKNNIGVDIAFGNFTSSVLEDEPFEICGGDCIEMWDIYNSIIRTVIPDFEIHTPFTNFEDTINIMCEDKKLLELSQSCIGPYRYRKYLHDNNAKKYNIRLPNNRCGSCWKCCLEYCVFCDKGLYEYNEQYYKHCLDILRNTMKKENNITASMEDVWQHYFFWDMDKSMYFKK